MVSPIETEDGKMYTSMRQGSPNNKKKFSKNFVAGSLLAVVSVAALASSHREAPSITTTPKADGTDFYMFRSYETDRSDFITVIANYQPLQDGYGGPNYFSMDPNALYEIHIDNDGDAQEEITFQFNFKNGLQYLSIERYSAELLLLIMFFLCFEWISREKEHPFFGKWTYVRLGVILFSIITLGVYSDITDFIYFQF